MQTAPLGPSEELPVGLQTTMGETHANCATGTFGGAPYKATEFCTGCGDACELRHWDLRWSSL
eukprot:6690652-Pyramimonas_sp.AAC.1